MKKAAAMAISALFLALISWAAIAQTTDLSGTWVGDTVVPNSPEKDGLTLVLKKDGSNYTGTISDSMGMANQAVLEKVKIENGTLTFQFKIFDGTQDILVATTLKVSGEKMSGSWQTENDSGAVALERKK